MALSGVCIYPGSFDPITNGHLNIIERSLKIFRTVIVAVAINAKKTPLFSIPERVKLIEDSLKETLSEEDLKRVKVDHFEGLLIDYAKKKKARAIIRGLRAVSDFEFEFQMASMNRKLSPDVEMLFMMTDESNFYISSQTVKEVLSLGGCVEGLVPKAARRAMVKKFKERKQES